VCEAGLFLVWAQLLIRFVPYARWAPLVGPIVRTEPSEPRPLENRESVRHAVTAVETASRHIPWGAVCLPRAMAAKWILRRRNIASTLHLGIRRGAQEPGDTELHAWLTVEGEIWVGGDVADRFTVIARYGEKPQRS
jgi:hypothetical protein